MLPKINSKLFLIYLLCIINEDEKHIVHQQKEIKQVSKSDNKDWLTLINEMKLIKLSNNQLELNPEDALYKSIKYNLFNKDNITFILFKNYNNNYNNKNQTFKNTKESPEWLKDYEEHFMDNVEDL